MRWKRCSARCSSMPASTPRAARSTPRTATSSTIPPVTCSPRTPRPRCRNGCRHAGCPCRSTRSSRSTARRTRRRSRSSAASRRSMSSRAAAARAAVPPSRRPRRPRSATCGAQRRRDDSAERPKVSDEFRSGHVASVGKSTLLNRLVGHRISITSRKPQTTRHRIVGVLTEPGRQFAFVDTPGFQTRHRSRLNDRLNRTVTTSLADVDVVVLVVDSARLTDADRAVSALIPPTLPAIAAVNKVDALAAPRELLPRLAELATWRDFAAIVPVSAEKGVAFDALKDEIARRLPLSPALYDADTLTDRDERFLAAELIREKIFRLLGEELP